MILLGSPDIAAALCLSETECYVRANLSVRPGYDGIICDATILRPLSSPDPTMTLYSQSRPLQHLEVLQPKHCWSINRGTTQAQHCRSRFELVQKICPMLMISADPSASVIAACGCCLPVRCPQP